VHLSEIDRGPWSLSRSYLQSYVQREVDGVKRESEGKSRRYRGTGAIFTAFFVARVPPGFQFSVCHRVFWMRKQWMYCTTSLAHGIAQRHNVFHGQVIRTHANMSDRDGIEKS
jgi:hypothetical protein